MPQLPASFSPYGVPEVTLDYDRPIILSPATTAPIRLTDADTVYQPIAYWVHQIFRLIETE